MIRYFIAVIFLLFVSQSIGQEKVQWLYGYSVERGQIEIKAEIAEGWHLYSQHIANEIGPIPTSFEFEENSSVTFIGEVEEPESIKEYDPNFEGDLNFFKNEVVFVQHLQAKESTIVEGTVTFMVCNETMCLPPEDVQFKITIDK